MENVSPELFRNSSSLEEKENVLAELLARRSKGVCFDDSEMFWQTLEEADSALRYIERTIFKWKQQIACEQKFAQYQEWISQQGDVTKRCFEVCQSMCKVFPELKLVKGFYYCHITGKPYPHWWLETQSNLIVDPTAKQFASSVMGDYIRIDESKPEPTGVCHNCGGPYYDNALLCSMKCTTEYAEFCMNGGA